MARLLDTAIAAQHLPPTYDTHPVKTSAPPGVPVFPIALYVDAVPFSRYDSAVGFYGYCMLTGIRHLFAALRKCDLCKCGCGGWCSYYPVFLMIAWSLVAGAKGVWPLSRHDETDFWPTEGDDIRRNMAGHSIEYRAALCVTSYACFARVLLSYIFYRAGCMCLKGQSF